MTIERPFGEGLGWRERPRKAIETLNRQDALLPPRIAMQFVVTHTHEAHDCPSDKPDLMKRLGHDLSDVEAMKKGLKLLGAYVAPLEHTFYFLLESDTLAKVRDFLKPIGTLGTANVVPVDEFQKVVRQLTEGR